MITSILVNDLDQKATDLIATYPNQPLLLLFYNNRCLGCTGRAIPLANEFQKQYKSIKVIGIHSNFTDNNTTKADIKSIFTINHLPFPIYIDNNHKVYDDFNCEGTPQWVLITKSGMLYRSIFGSQLGAQNRLSYALEALIEAE